MQDPFYEFGSTPQLPDAPQGIELFASGARAEMPFAEPEESVSLVEDYAFRVKDDGDGTVSVSAGYINTEAATGLTPAGKPTQLWLKATLNASSVVTAAAVVTSSAADSATETYRQIATITWNGDAPTITQGIRGSQNLVSCGASHEWASLYG